MWGQYPLEIHHIEVRCNVEQPTKPRMTVASLRSAYFNMVGMRLSRPVSPITSFRVTVRLATQMDPITAELTDSQERLATY